MTGTIDSHQVVPGRTDVVGPPAPDPGAHDPASDRLVPIPRARGRVRGALLRRVLPWLVRQVRDGSLEVVLPDGKILRGGTNDGISGRIDLHDPRVFQQLGARGQMGFGEAYVLGMWSSDDPATAIEVIVRSWKVHQDRPLLRFMRRLGRLRPSLQRRNPPRSAKKHIAYHYDLGNDFFDTFLDESMTYSCAVFAPGSDDLTAAQAAKYAGICAELALGPDDHVLEIGCGWGGFAEYAARTTGAKVTGVTISERQHAYATERIAAAGLDGQVDIRLQDYRDVTGTFSKIVSIEMLEAVGAREYGRFFRTVDRLLAPGGSALVQVIGFQDRDYATQLRTKGWIRRYVFPGGMLPTVNVLARTMMRVSHLQMHGLHEIGQHYGPTLSAWRTRLIAHGDVLSERGYGARLQRSWDYYFAMCEAGFRSGHIRVMQVHITRAGTLLP